jgi:hypothetical protein
MKKIQSMKTILQLEIKIRVGIIQKPSINLIVVIMNLWMKIPKLIIYINQFVPDKMIISVNLFVIQPN